MGHNKIWNLKLLWIVNQSGHLNKTHFFPVISLSSQQTCSTLDCFYSVHTKFVWYSLRVLVCFIVILLLPIYTVIKSVCLCVYESVCYCFFVETAQKFPNFHLRASSGSGCVKITPMNSWNLIKAPNQNNGAGWENNHRNKQRKKRKTFTVWVAAIRHRPTK